MLFKHPMTFWRMCDLCVELCEPGTVPLVNYISRCQPTSPLLPTEHTSASKAKTALFGCMLVIVIRCYITSRCLRVSRLQQKPFCLGR